jgi:hypothetical protein
MKKIISILFICCGVLCFSCNSKQEDEIRDENTFSDIGSLTLIKDYNFPEWLSTAIKEMETMYARDVYLVKIQIYECEWLDRKVYFIYNSLNSCIFCEVYYTNGEKIEWPRPDMSTDFYASFSTSKNWKFIYEFGEFIGSFH